MKKSLVALALMGAFSAAYAQSSVTIYGTLDAGVTKATGSTTAIGKRDNNKLGFKGVEDLGSGLKALFQLEIRYEPDTGTIESTSGVNSRPLFQGESRVGLQGEFGTVRLGRGLTPFQASITAFEPWSGIPSVAGFQTDLQVAAYNSSPLDPAGTSKNRFSNAVWYNSPVIGGMFQLNAAVGAKEANGNPAVAANPATGVVALPAGMAPLDMPYSLSVTANNGPFAAMAAYERNVLKTKLWSIAASVTPTTRLKLMASYQHQDQDEATKLFDTDTKSWILGANYTIGAGKILAGYGQKTPDGMMKTKQTSLGYEYSLSTRTYVYAEGSHRRNGLSATTSTGANFYAVGIHHNF